MTAHGFTTCDCVRCHAALLDLQDELGELERTDPDVKAAAESYGRMVERVVRRCTCQVRSDAIGPHTRGCPNHPEAAL